ncbi:MAG: sulfatase-like hydrolase/transferase, partial [Planctomycetes bacterium]|nr:sulfatase-like hydrolase/transferase [Planctomycetota bacterium]
MQVPSLSYGLCICLLTLGLPASIHGLDAPTKPNIVLIVADDLGWKDVGYHGSEIRTPHIDRLGASGSKLEQHYVAVDDRIAKSSAITRHRSVLADFPHTALPSGTNDEALIRVRV